LTLRVDDRVDPAPRPVGCRRPIIDLRLGDGLARGA
jgi:hypothetical protein